MDYSRRPKTKGEFLAAAEAVPSTGFDSKGLEGILTPITEPAEVKPWANEDPMDSANVMFSLRLNRYEIAMLRWLADQNEDLSMQKITRRILVPELQRRVEMTK